MLTLSAGPEGVFKAGAVRTLKDEDAAPLIEGGYAVSLDDAPSKQTSSSGKKSSGKSKDKEPDKEPDKNSAGDPPPPDGDPK